jgi:hypothetical protein
MEPSKHLILAIAFALPLATAAAQAEPAPAVRQDSNERVICKKAAPAGTRFRTETCYTMAEWDKLSETARRDMGEMVFREGKKKRAR